MNLDMIMLLLQKLLIIFDGEVLEKFPAVG